MLPIASTTLSGETASVTPHDAHLRVWLATPEAADRLDITRLSATDAEQWQAIRTARRRRDWASSRALLAAVPMSRQCSHSLSHSGGYAALVTASSSVRVGIDIETVTPRDFPRLAEAAYSPDEAVYLQSVDPAALPARFYEYWTLKESFAKALGMPLMEALTKCRFADASGAEVPSIPTAKPWRATVFAPRPQLRLAVACIADSVDALGYCVQVQEWPKHVKPRWATVLDMRCTGGSCTPMPGPAICAPDESCSRQ